MKTTFQKTLPKDKDTLWEIVKILHPDIPDTWTAHNGKEMSIKEYRLSAYIQYDWVCISFRVKNYGQIDIGIKNGEHGFYGSNYSKKDFENIYNSNHEFFNVWRFTMDKLYNDPINGHPYNKVIELLKQRGYTKQSPTEMFKYYYHD